MDSRPLFEGKKLLKNLVNTSLEKEVETNSVASSTIEKVPITQSHISVQYVLINALSSTF